MLQNERLIALVASTDLERSRAFYGGALSLPQVGEDEYGITFESNGARLRVSRVEALTPAPYTVVGWGVANIADSIRALTAGGVTFERYDWFPQDELGVWTAPDGSKVAWFKDPEGNTLSLTEFAAG
jgi:YD repeat-containing protein